MLLQKDLSILIKVHIEILCLLGMFDKAYEEMKYYQNLPYASQVVEELLAKLPEYIRAEEKKAYSGHEMDDAQIKNLTRSGDLNDVIIALDLIKERDISKFLEDIKWLMINHSAQSIRSFSLFVLVQKKVPGVFVFKHIEEIIEVEPTKLEPPFMGDWFNDLVRKLTLELNDPSLSENAIQILSSHLMFIYPDKIDNSDEELIEALYQISGSYLHSKKESLEDRCALKGLSIERVQKLIDTINFSLENF